MKNSSAKAPGTSWVGCSLLTKALLLVAVFPSAFPSAAMATVVRYETILGDIDVRLYDTATPASVANFMNYLNDGDWDDSFIHRSIPGFIVQGGGFNFSDQGGVASVPTDSPVVNEYGISNLRGTVAYAKTAVSPDTATSQWFFNLDNNSANLDNQNGGFTVFGRVLGDGMDVVDAIAALPLVNAGGAFASLPYLGTLGPSILDENLVTVTTVTELMFDDADYNFDGVVDAADYTVWRDANGSTTAAEADGNGDGVVDGLDYNLWAANFSNGAAAVSAGTTVPEPTALMLALFGGTFCACRRR